MHVPASVRDMPHTVCSCAVQVSPGSDPPCVRTNPDAWGLDCPRRCVTTTSLARFRGHPLGTFPPEHTLAAPALVSCVEMWRLS
eukprot:3088685-Heterocapsa_arctica.AAC.1